MWNVISGKQFLIESFEFSEVKKDKKKKRQRSIGGMGIEHGGGLWRRWKRGQWKMYNTIFEVQIPDCYMCVVTLVLI